ncbi:unnamed protein product, partial [Ectocarpus sp. 8 AP-2014]
GFDLLVGDAFLCGLATGSGGGIADWNLPIIQTVRIQREMWLLDRHHIKQDEEGRVPRGKKERGGLGGKCHGITHRDTVYTASHTHVVICLLLCAYTALVEKKLAAGRGGILLSQQQQSIGRYICISFPEGKSEKRHTFQTKRAQQSRDVVVVVVVVVVLMCPHDKSSPDTTPPHPVQTRRYTSGFLRPPRPRSSASRSPPTRR